MIRSKPAPAPFVAPEVLVLNFDPILHSKESERLHEVCQWNDPYALTDGYIADLADCSGGYLHYRIVEWQDVDAYPVKKDGFRYTDRSYLRCREGKGQWHQPDAVDYRAILQDFGIPARVERDEIEEV